MLHLFSCSEVTAQFLAELCEMYELFKSSSKLGCHEQTSKRKLTSEREQQRKHLCNGTGVDQVIASEKAHLQKFTTPKRSVLVVFKIFEDAVFQDASFPAEMVEIKN